MVQPVPHHSQNWIAGIAGKPRRFRDVADFDRRENLFDPLGVASEPTSAPPEDSFDHDRQRDDRYEKDRPHDRTALIKVINDEIATPTTGFRRGCRARTWTQRRSDSGSRSGWSCGRSPSGAGG